MNNLYLACTDCKVYTDVGYRWAYWELEHTGIVSQGQPVDLPKILGATGYWNPPIEKRSDWLYDDVLPAVKSFIHDHTNHHVIYGEDDCFLPENTISPPCPQSHWDLYVILNWKQTGGCANESPRRWAEDLKLRSWDEVCTYIDHHDTNKPYWWDDHALMPLVKQRFLELLLKPHAYHQQITSLSAKGDRFAKDAKHAKALAQYWAAWDLLPEPKTNWEAATWLLAAIGDANFLSGDFAAGRDNLANAMHCPDAIGNPFLHMRLGQCQFELGNLDRAADELARAYLAKGDGLFKDEDPKYVLFLKTKLKPPAGGWDGERKKPWWKFW